MGKITKIEVENFKSYKDSLVIGPFKNFTAVIGPNGAGKSNLMDAISFVLGVQSKQLRSESLNELVYDADERRDVEKRKARVSLFYQPSDSEMDGNEEEFVLSRTVNYKGSSSYFFNSQAVSWEKYNSILKRIGVLVKARNFLVFQGDVESIASMSSDDRMKHFEEISGSIEFKEEFDKVVKLKLEAEKVERENVTAKKEIQKEKNQVKEQQKIAQEHHKKKQKLKETYLEYYLWQLFQVKRDLDRVQKLRVEHEKGQLELEEKEADVGQRLETMKTDLVAAKESKKTVQKNLMKSKNELRENEERLTGAKDSFERVSFKLKSKKEEQIALNAAKKENEKNIKSLTQKATEINDAIERLCKDREEQDAKVREQNDGLTEKQLVELFKVREKIKSLTADEKDMLDQITSEKTVQKDAKSRLETVRNLKQSEMEDLIQSKQVLVCEEEEQSKAAEELKSSLDHFLEKRNEAQDEVTKLSAKKKVLFEKFEVERQQFEKINSANQENRRERESFDECQALKDKHLGVLGRLVDQIEAKDKKFEVALTTAIGNKNLQAVIVEDLGVARTCSRHLQEHRLRPRNFMPLDTLRIDKRHESKREGLRTFSEANGQRFTLALDVVNIIAANVEDQSSVKQALKFALGSTVICKDLEDAKYFVYTQKEIKCKVVTLDGEVISADGSSMSGGFIDKSARNQFERRDTEKLMKRMEKLDDEIKKVSKEMQQHEKVLSGENEQKKAELEAKLQRKQKDLKVLSSRVTNISKDIAKIEKELDSMRPEIEAAEKLLEEIESREEEVEQKVLVVETELISKFEKQYKVKDVQLYERRALKEAEDYSEKMNALKGQQEKIASRLKGFETVDLEEQIKSVANKIKSLEKELKKRKEKYAAQKSALNESIEQVEMAEREEKEMKKKLSSFQKQVKTLLSERDLFQKEKANLTRPLLQCENDLEHLRDERHQLLTEATVNGVQIPKHDDVPLTQTQLRQTDGSETTLPSQSQSTNDNDAASSTNEETFYRDSTADVTMKNFSQDDSETVQKENKELSDIDFTEFIVNCKRKATKDRFKNKNITGVDAEQKETVKQIFLNEITLLNERIKKTQPQVVGVEDLKNVEGKLKQNSKSWQQAVSERKKYEDRYNELHAERMSRLSKMFDHVSSVIDKIYKDLTKSQTHRFGGSAEIDLEDSDHPWEGGIKFTTTPPSKKYRDMSQLSGGEKTVAALALLFAIHSFHPAPFFVMDEIDAALDNVNVMKVSNYIKKNSVNYQCIVISLKTSFYDKANALVGVCKDQDRMSSDVYTLDLDQYPEQ